MLACQRPSDVGGEEHEARQVPDRDVAVHDYGAAVPENSQDEEVAGETGAAKEEARGQYLHRVIDGEREIGDGSRMKV